MSSSKSTTSYGIQTLNRNPGTELDLDWALSCRANTSAIERRCRTLTGRRSIKKANQAAWLLKAITCIDLTTLSGDDTERNVSADFAKKQNFLYEKIFWSFEIESGTSHTGAICVYHDMVKAAVSALEGTKIPVAAVSTGFPAGLSPFSLRLAEIGESVKDGAKEIDIVISRRHVLSQDWQSLYDEMKSFS